MNVSRAEIMPGVNLTCVTSNKFKSACMSLSLLTQLNRENASLNALIPYVLRRGTTAYPNMEKISARLDDMYGAAIEPLVRRFGEIQSIGFYASFPEPVFLPGNDDVFKDSVELMCQMLLNPVTKGGLFLPQYVEGEKEKLLDAIRSRINDKRGYAVFRCLEEMCCFEDFGVSSVGDEEDCENIRYDKLTRHYRKLLQTSPVEIFYCGREKAQKAEDVFKRALVTLPRGEIDWEIGTDVRMNAVEAQPRCVKEEMDVSQGVLVAGFRLGDAMEEMDIAALNVFNCIYGGGSASKLFTNLRERRQLCYYASSSINIHKGIMIAACGIEPENFDEARDALLFQLDEIKNGNISDEELSAAKLSLASDYKALEDGQYDMESFFVSQTLLGLDYIPAELAELVNQVTKEDIIKIAQGVECDMIYFLTEYEEDEDGEI